MNGAIDFSLSLMIMLRVAYIPEHFSTPLFLAKAQGFYKDAGVEVEFIPIIEGTGRLIKLLNDNEVDIAIGLTEGFVSDIAKGNEAYKVIDSYVTSPLCWAVSTGVDRSDINNLSDLQGKNIGVSRIGSGSYIMSFVLGLQLKFSDPFFKDHIVCSNFKNLRDSVNLKWEHNSDGFMWEHFTSKKYYDEKEIKKIGEIYTPWPSWVITANKEKLAQPQEIKSFLSAINKGIDYFLNHPEQAVTHIASNLDYSDSDAKQWLTTVKFNEQLGQVPIDWKSVVDNTAEVLKTAGVLTDDDKTISDRLINGINSSPL